MHVQVESADNNVVLPRRVVWAGNVLCNQLFVSALEAAAAAAVT